MDLPLKTSPSSLYIFEEFRFEKIKTDPSAIHIKIKLKTGEIYEGGPMIIVTNGQTHVIRVS